MKKSLCLLGLMLCVGCTTALVRPYVGEQQNWPIATGSIVNTRYSLPIFTSLPTASYDILAEMRIESPLYAQPEEGHLSLLAKKAKTIGADALMFVQGQIFFAANYGSRTEVEAEETDAKKPTLTQVNRFNPESFKPGVTIVAIKWTGEPPAGLGKKEEKEAPKEEEKKEEAMPETPVVMPTPEQPAPPAPEAVTPPTPEGAPAADTNEVPAAPLAPEVAPAPLAEPVPAVTNETPAVEQPTAPPAPEAPTEPAPAPANP